jgi:hypothetical protein
MTPTTSTTTRLVPRNELTDDDADCMFRLLSSHFEGVTGGHFRNDLSDKNWVILIERGESLVGFTTLRAYETTFEGGPISVIYSGDTIVAPEAWNTQSLPRAWIASVANLRRQYPRGLYVWLLITSGFRTYRFLPVFWKNFFPRHDVTTPSRWQRLLEHIASERFGDQYNREEGIVRLRHAQCLKAGLSTIPIGRYDDPDVAFFASQNPRHAHGDELVCLTELSPENLTPAGRRMASSIQTW